MIDSTIFSVDSNNLTMRIQQAEMYLKEFENEVKRANGSTGIFRAKDDALERIKILNEFAPNDPRVQDLFLRARKCIMGSSGNFIDITDDMLAYLRNEEELLHLSFTYDDMNIVKKMKEIVPEYKSRQSKYEVLDK